MSKIEIILSGGSILWLNINESLSYALNSGYDGLEILPTRSVTKEIEDAIKIYGKNRWFTAFRNPDLIKGVHQSWRLDIGLDKEYKINFLWGLFFTAIRIIFFPSIDKSKKIIELVSEKLHLPVTVHGISNDWTHVDNEFSGGIFFEVMNPKRTNPAEIKKWLMQKQHKIVLDTRDDQSLFWAKNYRFENWKSLWEWIGLQNIGGIQLTLIGKNGLSNILNHKVSLAEEQFLWLYAKGWQGTITVEVNPLILFIVSRGRLRKGFKTIADFVRQTAANGKRWSG